MASPGTGQGGWRLGLALALQTCVRSSRRRSTERLTSVTRRVSGAPELFSPAHPLGRCPPPNTWASL